MPTALDIKFGARKTSGSVWEYPVIVNGVKIGDLYCCISDNEHDTYRGDMPCAPWHFYADEWSGDDDDRDTPLKRMSGADGDFPEFDSGNGGITAAKRAMVKALRALHSEEHRCAGCGRLPMPPDFYPCSHRNCDNLAAMHFGTGDDRRWQR